MFLNKFIFIQNIILNFKLIIKNVDLIFQLISILLYFKSKFNNFYIL